MKQGRKNPRNYDGPGRTAHHIKELLPEVLMEIGRHHKSRGDLVCAAWAEVIGPQLAPMTQAISFVEGNLSVKVKNSSLLSLLSQHERGRLLKALREKFPQTVIKTITFRLG